MEHIMKKHGLVVRSNSEKQTPKRKCDDCEKEYNDRHGLSRHRRKYHPEEVKEARRKWSHVKCQEPECNFTATSINDLRFHLEFNHQMSFSVVQKRFSTIDGMTEYRPVGLGGATLNAFDFFKSFQMGGVRLPSVQFL